jgi:hypothetical protein
VCTSETSSRTRLASETGSCCCGAYVRQLEIFGAASLAYAAGFGATSPVVFLKNIKGRSTVLVRWCLPTSPRKRVLLFFGAVLPTADLTTTDDFFVHSALVLELSVLEL